MTKSQPVKQSTSNAARGKGTYASRACNVCKRKKIKCDETRPVCGSCDASGRSSEGKVLESLAPEAHFEAMRKRADALERYATILESMLEKCQREHGGTFHDGQSYLQFRPNDCGEERIEIQGEGDLGLDGDDVAAAEICVSAENLTLDDGDLVFYGNAAPFRFAKTLPKHVSIIPDVEIDLSARYMLMVEGADQTHYNPDFDWSRYLPSQVPLDRKEHDRVLDLLFKFFTSWCMRIVPVLFLRDMYRFLNIPRCQTPPKTSHYSPMLHNALLAVATGFSDDPLIRDYKARKYFADEAKRLMESEVQRPNVSVVHALSILGSFHSSSGEQGLGYVYFGISSRVSQALGLSVDCSAWVKSGLITTHDMYDRYWAYWTNFTQEMCWCLYVGRDFTVSISDTNSIPVPYVDAEYDQIDWFHPSANIAPQPNYLSTTFAATCELMNIARRVMSVINLLHVSSNRREVKDEQISSIDYLTAIDMKLANKHTATPHKIVLHLSFWWTFILLHRPFFHRKKRVAQDAASRDIDHVKLCKRAADNIMDLLGIYRTLYTLRYVPVTPVQIVFAAGTVYVLLAVQATTGLRVAKKELETYIARAELCVQYLTEIGRSWKCASDIADILKGLMTVQLKPVLERRAMKDASGKKSGRGTAASSSSDPMVGDAMDEFEISSAATNTGFDTSTSSMGTYSDTDSFFSNQPNVQPSSSYAASFPDSFSSSISQTETSLSSPDFLRMLQSDLPSIPSSLPSTESFILQGFAAPHSALSSMETTGFLAMIGGEAMSHTPAIPPFSSMEYTDYADDFMNMNHLGNYFPSDPGMMQTEASSSGIGELGGLDIVEDPHALKQFIDQL
ncbi:hypothetical protein BT96DRAFT_918021 [Gymnopus androsaceus JB14]|uniref:Zn(2)-C6 fungal-type domain-containing protein n=1 Tax=Gymnopus androsaceus JB14 TaxID=1447944 RepID=A0A6A4HU30_9AGAR|nr:hypothetical protein BT96DRAFT_918021 [Gymnopus androsaceus JB14]